MTWNYRIIKHDMKRPNYLAVHEVYYDNETGKVTAWTEDPVGIIGDDENDIRKVIKHIVSDSKLPVLDESKLLKGLDKQKSSKTSAGL